MSIWGKLAGGAAGFALGGPLGALIGAVTGHMVIDRAHPSHHDGRPRPGEPGMPGDIPDNIAFTVGVIALGAKMAKADGVVTKDEIAAFQEVFKVPEGEVKNVARIFDLAKQDVAGYEAYARQLYQILGDSNRQLLQDVLDGLFHIAKADGVIHPKEEAFLADVAGIMGFSETEFGYIRARHIRESERNPYEVLGVSEDISDAALKKHYHKLVSENHPDRLMARGVPEEFVKIATEKLAAINDAYQKIRKERRL